MSIDAQLYGVDLFGEPMRPKVISPVAQKFLIPPLSILDGRRGDWLDRKRAWKEIGLRGELGRGSELLGPESPNSCYGKSNATQDENGDLIYQPSVGCTSIFDPVVCELAYRWFTGEGAQIIDPFAGGSVRGVVASCLGRNYWGCDLRAEQIEANRAQGEELCQDNPPQWVCGDSLSELDSAPMADFVFSCPPYGDLEKYSDDPLDLSSMDHQAFLVAYRAIIAKACGRLKQDRFACFVVGDFRDKKGNYRNFVSDTIQAFLDAGMNYYNEAILVVPDGSACMRVTKQFKSGRKIVKTHQNILVFVKGDGKRATLALEEKPLAARAER